LSNIISCFLFKLGGECSDTEVEISRLESGCFSSPALLRRRFAVWISTGFDLSSASLVRRTARYWEVLSRRKAHILDGDLKADVGIPYVIISCFLLELSEECAEADVEA
jgi:hypothetical protein